MAKADIWMPIYIGDYLADTMHLTTEQHGAYLLLIMAYWRNGGPLPSSDQALSAITRLTPDAWSMHKHMLAAFFDTESVPGVWVLSRADREIADAGNNKEKRVVRAKNAAAARWGNDASSNATSIPQAMLKECPSPSPSPSKEKQDQKTRSTPSAEHVDFDRFWSIYPRKVGKQAAAKAWEKIKPDMILFAEIEEAITAAKRSPDWLKDAGRFIPHPSAWLNGKRWEDETDPIGALPYEEIAAAYNDECGRVFRPCESMTPERMILVRRLAAQEIAGKRRFIEGGIGYWRRFFAAASRSSNWAGNNRNNFVADFDHVIKNANSVFEVVK